MSPPHTLFVETTTPPLETADSNLLQQPATLWNSAFVSLCVASFLFFCAYHLLTTALPVYFNDLHQPGWMLGLLTSAFMVSSMLIRPFAGHYADAKGAPPLMLIGAIVFALFTVGLLLFKTPVGVLALRIGQGLGFSLFYGGSSALITQLVPATRRAQGIGHYSNAIKLAIALAPMAGLTLAQKHWFTGAFTLVALLSVLAASAVWLLQQHTFKPAPVKPKRDKTTRVATALKPLFYGTEQTTARRPLFCKKAVFPGFIIASNSLVFGALMPFIPLIAKQYAIVNAHWFYGLYAAALIASRWGSGSLSDTYGRSAVIIPGMVLVVVAIGILACSHSLTSLLVGAVLYGFGAGVVQPSLIAMVADRTSESNRGSAMATFTLFTDGGQAVGATIMGSVAASSYSVGLLACAGLCALGLVAYCLKIKRATGERFAKPLVC